MAAPVASPAVGGPQIVISERIIKRLGEHARLAIDGRQGFLYGFKEASAINIVGCTLSKSLTEKNFAEKLAKNSSYFPAGIDPVGVFVLGGQGVARLKTIVPVQCRQQCSALVELPTALIAWAFPDDGSSHLYWYDVSTGATTAASFVSSGLDAGLQSSITFRMKANLTVAVEHTGDSSSVSAPVVAAFTELRQKLSASIVKYLVAPPGKPVPLLLHGICSRHSCCATDNEGADVAKADDSECVAGTCADLLLPTPAADRQQHKKKASGSHADDAVINVELLLCLSTDAAVKASRDCSPVLFCDQKPLTVSFLCLPLDVLAVVDRSSALCDLPAIFRRGMLSQIDRMQRTLTHFQNNNLSNPLPYHFKPSESLHHVTLIYCDAEPDADLESYRKFVHQKFLLPTDRPLFRRANRCWPVEGVVPPLRDIDGGGEGQKAQRPTAGSQLRNVHIGLPSSGVKDGRVSCVRGWYSYHHYMQDGMDDAGWGCAYRSLQTLVSWFRLQGYTDVNIPTHRQIQEVLVAVGDKAPTFVGSKQWIGSLEVSYCLEKLLGVTSKILFVASGAELATKARELVQHFDSQGTPIMIGGGVLAHTILGVDYSDLSGDIRFLVLDPHYTGGEDLKVIQEKGWCAWKGPGFWDPAAHYNLCMPQPPLVV